MSAPANANEALLSSAPTRAAPRPARLFDVLVIGGGIVGAGIMREAARCGLRVLLVEQGDFGSGTSSRTSKLVHGGLHYLARFRFGLAREAVTQRERMMREGRGLVEPMPFILPTNRDGPGPRRWQAALALSAYELLAGRVRLPGSVAPGRNGSGGAGDGFTSEARLAGDDFYTYSEATTDDAGMVLRVIRDGVARGGVAENYVACTELLRDGAGRVRGARLYDRERCSEAAVYAHVVVNATGPWADRLSGKLGAARRVRAVRGSHLIIQRRRLPLKQAVASLQSAGGQPIYCIPWNGVTLIGSTAVDHTSGLDSTPSITPAEVAALLQGVNRLFPTLDLRHADVQATFAGVRPLADRETDDPGRASREDRIWEDDDGLITVTGGKLTTFHAIARRVLGKVVRHLPGPPPRSNVGAAFDELPLLPSGLPFSRRTAIRLAARYGAEGLAAMAAMPASDHQTVCQPNGDRDRWPLRGELRWAARAEDVRHLDDLLLRRVRIGLTVRGGGRALLPGLRPVIESELGWEPSRCRFEEERYLEVWRASHGVPAI